MKPNQTITLQGNGVSPGIAIGQCYILDRSRAHVRRRSISPAQIAAEKDRFRDAMEETARQLIEIRHKLDNKLHREPALIIDTHISILGDEMLTGEAIKRIEKEKVNAEWALRAVIQETHKVFNEIDDPYLRERVTDIDYVGERLMNNLAGEKLDSVGDIDREAIILSHDLSPAETAQMNKDKILGFVTTIGGTTSHTAIVARSLEIPAVVGVADLLSGVKDGDKIIVDGGSGKVIVRPDPITTEHFIRLGEEYEESERELHENIHLPAETRDGHRVVLSANLEIIDELPLLKKHGAEGVGLYRTEYMFLDRQSLPTEEEHFRSYKAVIEGASPHGTTIRTLDLGGDKFSHALPMANELNPAMGLRAIRFCLKESDIFRTQLRAILRASSYGKVRIMFPMISGLGEIRMAKQHLEEIKQQLLEEGAPFDENIKIGSMIEVPSASVLADQLAKEVDFFSIGTNDLIQYTLAIDRVNERVNYLYEPLHPAVLRIIRNVTEAGRRANIEVAMCGEMAGNPVYVPLLVGLGINSMSMTAQSVPRVKKILRAISLAETIELAQQVFELDTAKDIESLLLKTIREKWGSAFPKDILEQQPDSPPCQ